MIFFYSLFRVFLLFRPGWSGWQISGIGNYRRCTVDFPYDKKEKTLQIDKKKSLKIIICF